MTKAECPQTVHTALVMYMTSSFVRSTLDDSVLADQQVHPPGQIHSQGGVASGATHTILWSLLSLFLSLQSFLGEFFQAQ